MSYFTRTNNPLLTVLLPSRNRFDLCKNTVDSFVDTCRDKSNLQIILKFDVDDLSSVSRINEIRKDVDIKILISDRLRGYFSLHHFCNDMMKVSTGDWIIMVNDDSLMTTNGWDDVLQNVIPPQTGEFWGTSDTALLNFYHMDKHTTTYPVVRRCVCEKLGYFTLHPHNDAFLNEVYGELNAIVCVPDIRMRHLNNEVNDHTRLETATAQFTSMNDFSHALCEQTALKIRELFLLKT